MVNIAPEKVKMQVPDVVADRQNPKDRDRLIMEYAPLVKRVAYRIVSRLPDTIMVEDLISIGTLGLIDAVGKYNPDKGKGFKAYAELRIKGSILDELRGYDNLSRANRRRANVLGQTIQDLEQKLGHEPSDEEVAKSLGVEMSELHTVRNNTRTVVFLDIDDVGYVTDSDSDSVFGGHNGTGDFAPYRYLANKAIKGRLTTAIEKLPEKLRLVVSLYYFNELNYKEIGKVMTLSESRISQLHTKAVMKLKKIMTIQETEI